MGRPLKSSEPMTKRVTIRMTESDFNNLEIYAKKQEKNKIDLVRELILKAIEE